VSQTGQWDAICVGAGITSLAFAAHALARSPTARILVVDKHTVPGGYASVFHRPKASAVFDCSLHKLSGTGDGGNLRRMFGALGLDKELQLKIPDAYFEAVFPGRRFVLPNDPLCAEQTLVTQFPSEELAIKDFFREVNTYGRHGYYQFQMLEGSYEADFTELRYAHRHLKTLSVRDALAARFSDLALREIIGATGIYVGGYPEDLSYLYFLHVVYATLCKGNAYIEGASQNLSSTLAKRITDAGGEVLLGTTVKEVMVSADHKAVGIQTSRGQFLSDRIYINASPHYAMSRLFKGGEELDGVKKTLQALKPSRATTTVYVTTDCSPADLGLTSCETMVFNSAQVDASAVRQEAQQMPTDEAICEYAYWNASPMEVTNYHRLDPSSGMSVCLNVLDSMLHWPERRSPTYKGKKQRALDTLLGRLIAAKPGLEGHIRYTEVASPRTYHRFTNNTDGAGYGAMVGTEMSGHTFHRQFPLEGIHFLSAWVAGPSYEAAFGFAEMKAKQWFN